MCTCHQMRPGVVRTVARFMSLAATMAFALPALGAPSTTWSEHWRTTFGPRAAVHINDRAPEIGSLVVDGDQISLMSTQDGSLRWETRIGGLLPQLATLGNRYAYVVSKSSLFVLAVETGTIGTVVPLSKPTSIRSTRDSIYVSDQKGIHRFSVDGSKHLSSTKLLGTLEAADDDFVAIYSNRQLRNGTIRNVLRVIRMTDERSKKTKSTKKGTTYKFRLLTDGSHQITRFSAGIMSFVDYSRSVRGTNQRKLFFTEANYKTGKKLRDINLGKHYTADDPDQFQAELTDNSTLVLVSHGPNRAGRIRAIALDHAKQRWMHPVLSSAQISRPIRGARSQKDIWVMDSSKDKTHTRIRALSLVDGSMTTQVTNKEHSKRFYVRANTLLLVASRGMIALHEQPKKLEVKENTNSQPIEPTWPTFRDRLVGFTVQFPTSWTLDRKKIRRYSAKQLSIPFVRRGDVGKRANAFIASIHILVRPSRRQTVSDLWSAIIKQRSDRSGTPATILSKRDGHIGKSKSLLGAYRFRNRFGTNEQARSMCIVSHGFAFEMRARVNPQANPVIWTEIDRILQTFRPRPGLTTPDQQATTVQ